MLFFLLIKHERATSNKNVHTYNIVYKYGITIWHTLLLIQAIKADTHAVRVSVLKHIYSVILTRDRRVFLGPGSTLEKDTACWWNQNSPSVSCLWDYADNSTQQCATLIKFDRSCYSKWNASNAQWDRSCCLLARDSDPTVPKWQQSDDICIVSHCFVIGKEMCLNSLTLRWTLTMVDHHLPFVLNTSNSGTFSFCGSGPQSRPGSLSKTSFQQRGEGYQLLSESWYRLNPFTIYIFASTSILSTR